MTKEQKLENEVHSLWKRGGTITKTMLEEAGFWPVAKSLNGTGMYGWRVGETNPYAGLYGTGWTIVSATQGNRVWVEFWTKGKGTRRKSRNGG